MQYLNVLLNAIGPLAVLVIIAAAARGRARTIGVVAAVVLVAASLGQSLLALSLPRLMATFDVSYAVAGAAFLPISLLGTVGLVVLAIGLVLASRRPAAVLAPMGQPAHPHEATWSQHNELR